MVVDLSTINAIKDFFLIFTLALLPAFAF